MSGAGPSAWEGHGTARHRDSEAGSVWEDAMWVSGVVRRKRHVALAEMVAIAGRTGTYEQPWRLTPHIWDHFGSEAAILEELQRDWRTALAGEIYVTIEAG